MKYKKSDPLTLLNKFIGRLFLLCSLTLYQCEMKPLTIEKIDHKITDFVNESTYLKSDIDSSDVNEIFDFHKKKESEHTALMEYIDSIEMEHKVKCIRIAILSGKTVNEHFFIQYLLFRGDVDFIIASLRNSDNPILQRNIAMAIGTISIDERTYKQLRDYLVLQNANKLVKIIINNLLIEYAMDSNIIIEHINFIVNNLENILTEGLLFDGDDIIYSDIIGELYSFTLINVVRYATMDNMGTYLFFQKITSKENYYEELYKEYIIKGMQKVKNRN